LEGSSISTDPPTLLTVSGISNFFVRKRDPSSSEAPVQNKVKEDSTSVLCYKGNDNA